MKSKISILLTLVALSVGSASAAINSGIGNPSDGAEVGATNFNPHVYIENTGSGEECVTWTAEVVNNDGETVNTSSSRCIPASTTDDFDVGQIDLSSLDPEHTNLPTWDFTFSVNPDNSSLSSSSSSIGIKAERAPEVLNFERHHEVNWNNLYKSGVNYTNEDAPTFNTVYSGDTTSWHFKADNANDTAEFRVHVRDPDSPTYGSWTKHSKFDWTSSGDATYAAGFTVSNEDDMVTGVDIRLTDEHGQVVSNTYDYDRFTYGGDAPAISDRINTTKELESWKNTSEYVKLNDSIKFDAYPSTYKTIKFEADRLEGLEANLSVTNATVTAKFRAYDSNGNVVDTITKDITDGKTVKGLELLPTGQYDIVLKASKNGDNPSATVKSFKINGVLDATDSVVGGISPITGGFASNVPVVGDLLNAIGNALGGLGDFLMSIPAKIGGVFA